MNVTILLATKNPGKASEFRRILETMAGGYRWRVLTASDVGLGEIHETGDTFSENAAIKALEASRQYDGIAVGEDSGLEVDLLGGAPGVNSHRFSPSGDDEDNNDKLLKELDGAKTSERTARYRCAVAVARRGQLLLCGEGSVEGFIANERRGKNGFGYDPLFYCPELGKTMGEATAQEKDRVSHRKRAIESILPGLVEIALNTRGE